MLAFYRNRALGLKKASPPRPSPRAARVPTVASPFAPSPPAATLVPTAPLSFLQAYMVLVEDFRTSKGVTEEQISNVVNELNQAPPPPSSEPLAP